MKRTRNNEVKKEKESVLWYVPVPKTLCSYFFSFPKYHRYGLVGLKGVVMWVWKKGKPIIIFKAFPPPDLNPTEVVLQQV